MKILFLILLVASFTFMPVFVNAESQTLPTEKDTLDVKLTYEPIKPGVLTKVNIDFINPQTQKVQEHIDYTIAVSKEGKTVFGPIPLTHTSLGSVKIPIEFNLGKGIYSVDIEVAGILFQPIPVETVSFDIQVGEPEQMICTAQYDPVCGIDGKTYSNLCVLQSFGASLDYEGECLDSKPELQRKTLCEDGSISVDGVCQVKQKEEEKKIPDWVKNIFGWYYQDQVSEDELLGAIKFLIEEKILVIN